jgi:hypothetical protein
LFKELTEERDRLAAENAELKAAFEKWRSEHGSY